MKSRVLAASQSGLHYDQAGVGRRVVTFQSLDGETAGFTLPVGEEEFGELQVGAEYDIEFTLVRSAEEVAKDQEATAGGVTTEADVAPSPSQSGVIPGAAPGVPPTPVQSGDVPAPGDVPTLADTPGSGVSPVSENAPLSPEAPVSGEDGSGETVQP